MKGLELSRRYYETVGKPALEKLFANWLPRLAVGLVGGQNVLGMMMNYPETTILEQDSAFG